MFLLVLPTKHPTPTIRLLCVAMHPGYSGVSKTALEDWPVQKILPSNTRSTCPGCEWSRFCFPVFAPTQPAMNSDTVIRTSEIQVIYPCKVSNNNMCGILKNWTCPPRCTSWFLIWDPFFTGCQNVWKGSTKSMLEPWVVGSVYTWTMIERKNLGPRPTT